MIRILISTFIVITLALNFSVEYSDATDSNKNQSSVSIDQEQSNQSIASYEKGQDCENCESDGCHHEKGHCAHHCSGLHNIITGQSNTHNEPKNISDTQTVSFIYANHYKNPYLDSKIIPPNFS